MVKVQAPSGRLAEAVIVDFEEESPWTTITLKDGSVLKLKIVPGTIQRLEGGFDVNGNPIYLIQSQMIMRVAEAKIRGDPTGAVPTDSKKAPKDPSVG